MSLKLIAPVLALASAFPATAQELSYAQFGIEFTNITADGFDRSVTETTGDVEFTIDQFVLGAAIANRAYDFDSGSDGEILNYSVYGAYAVTPEFLVGAGLTGIDVESTELSGYEVFAQYVTPAFGVAVNYQVPDDEADDFSLTSVFGEIEVSPGITIGAIYEDYEYDDIAFYALAGEYEEGPIFARAFYQAYTELDTYLVGLRGSYAINDMFSATAVLLRSEDYIVEEVTGVSLGAEYAVNDAFAVGGEFGRLEGSGNEADFFSLALTYEMGSQARLDRTMATAARDDRNFGLNAVFPDAGIGAGFSIF